MVRPKLQRVPRAEITACSIRENAFRETRYALDDVLGRERESELGLQRREGIRQRHVSGVVDRLLAQTHEQRRFAREPPRPRADLCLEVVVRDHAVHQPQFERVRGRDELAVHHQLVGLESPDVPIDEGGDHEREDADVDLRTPEPDRLLGEHEIARQRETERAGQHVAARCTDHRLPETADQLIQPRKAIQTGVFDDRGCLARERLEVAARREDLLV